MADDLREKLTEDIAGNLWGWGADCDRPRWARGLPWERLVKLHDDKAFYEAEHLVRTVRWQAKGIVEHFILDWNNKQIAEAALRRRVGATQVENNPNG